ncbi:hypothetical protein [Falsibacillus albus]|uniref:Uncharacterized protein n=1 Tax=Falsibacillus albus TaxID=2478915 RepID=A0A3L7JVC3_9BACI|nr:hypothetical protein [Falsibacillus albus]RLQ94194.1 hypothetical protein D9X91_14075 [Falsibacillus albus]
MSKSEVKSMKKWEKLRKNGKWNYIFYSGLIGWGLPTGLLVFILNHIFQHGIDIPQYFTAGWLKELAVDVLIFLLGGFFLGLSMWKVNESFYQEEFAKAKAEDDYPYKEKYLS